MYQPNLVELPTDVTPGRSWQSAGSAGAALTYRASFTAEAAPDGCLRVAGTITYSGGPRRSRQLEKTWCPDSGIAVEEWQGGGEQRRVARSAAPAEPAVPRTTDAVPNWRPPSWREQRYAA